MAQVFAEVLGLQEVSVHDGFFELGGSSLSATKVTHLLEQHIDRRVPLSLLFENPTVASFVAALNSVDATGVGRLLTPRNRPHIVELTGTQRALWTINQINPSSSAYNVELTLELDGPLDVEALVGALADVIARHEPLRTRYPLHDGEPVQFIVPTVDAVRELRVPIVETTPDRVEAEIEAVVKPGFDLTKTVATRAAILRLAADRHVLVFAVHHINADGGSLWPMARDLTAAYRARVAGETGLVVAVAERTRVQFADYALWRAERLSTRPRGEQRGAAPTRLLAAATRDGARARNRADREAEAGAPAARRGTRRLVRRSGDRWCHQSPCAREQHDAVRGLARGAGGPRRTPVGARRRRDRHPVRRPRRPGPGGHGGHARDHRALAHAGLDRRALRRSAPACPAPRTSPISRTPRCRSTRSSTT